MKYKKSSVSFRRQNNHTVRFHNSITLNDALLLQSFGGPLWSPFHKSPWVKYIAMGMVLLKEITISFMVRWKVNFLIYEGLRVKG